MGFERYCPLDGVETLPTVYNCRYATSGIGLVLVYLSEFILKDYNIFKSVDILLYIYDIADSCRIILFL